MPPKKRGAPHGNRNALKHGFYSAAFRQQERRLLARLSPTDLSSEIDLIRIANFRLLEALSQSPAPLDVDQQLAIVRAVNLSTQSITALLRTGYLMSIVAVDSPDLPALSAGDQTDEANPASTTAQALPLPSGEIEDNPLPQSEV